MKTLAFLSLLAMRVCEAQSNECLYETGINSTKCLCAVSPQKSSGLRKKKNVCEPYDYCDKFNNACVSTDGWMIPYGSDKDNKPSTYGELFGDQFVVTERPQPPFRVRLMAFGRKLLRNPALMITVVAIPVIVLGIVFRKSVTKFIVRVAPNFKKIGLTLIDVTIGRKAWHGFVKWAMDTQEWIQKKVSGAFGVLSGNAASNIASLAENLPGIFEHGFVPKLVALIATVLYVPIITIMVLQPIIHVVLSFLVHKGYSILSFVLKLVSLPFKLLYWFASNIISNIIGMLSSSVDWDKQAFLGEIMVSESPDVDWDEIGGLKQAKQELKDATELPLVAPHILKEAGVEPWRGVLLYGPPGTGKTHMARAVASSGSNAMISVSAAELIENANVDPAVKIKMLFEEARNYSPAVIFVDEIDSLCGVRNEGQSEKARNVVTQFLVQMDGLKKEHGNFIVIGATNTPWALDSAILSRFERRIYVPLPDEEARWQIFGIHLLGKKLSMSAREIKELARRTENYSARDLKTLIKLAAYQTVYEIKDIQAKDASPRPLTWVHFEKALKEFRSTAQLEDLDRLAKWDGRNDHQ